MTKYANIGGDSGVTHYEAGDDFIRVRFCDRRTYLYTVDSTGKDDVDQMIKLAIAGEGLNSFINRVVRSRYAAIE